MSTDELRVKLELQCDLKNEIKVFEVKNVNEACLRAHKETSSEGLIIIFGSFYTVAEAFLAIEPLRSVA